MNLKKKKNVCFELDLREKKRKKMRQQSKLCVWATGSPPGMAVGEGKSPEWGEGQIMWPDSMFHERRAVCIWFILKLQCLAQYARMR